MDILTKKVVDSVITRYSSLSSYIDLAVVETTYNIGTENQTTSKILLRTIFRKPNLFRFDRRYGHPTKTMPDTSITVWFDGNQGYFCRNKEKSQNASSVSSASPNLEKILDDCLVRSAMLAQSVNKLIHPLFFEHSRDMCAIKRDNWIASSSDDQYCLRSSRHRVFVDRDSLLISKIEYLDPLHGTRENTLFLTQSIDKYIDDEHFDKSAIEIEAMDGRILMEARKEIGAL